MGQLHSDRVSSTMQCWVDILQAERSNRLSESIKKALHASDCHGMDSFGRGLTGHLQLVQNAYSGTIPSLWRS
jgi:hypothetical protein